jgi:replicative DNA helicase
VKTDQRDDVDRMRLPPHSVEAEQSVLGGLLLDNTAWDRAGDLLADGDFYRYEHRLIYAAISGLVSSCKPADVITVYEQLQSLGKAEEVGGLVYLNALAQSVPSAANLRRYAEIVRERAVLRKLIAASDEIATSAFNPQGKSAAEVLDAAQSLVIQVAESGAKAVDEWDGIGTLAVRFADELSEFSMGTKAPDVIPTGIDDLDEKLNGGPRPGEVVTIGMRSGMGKTALGLTVLATAAGTGEPCGMFSMEMPKQQVNMRMVSMRSYVHLTKLKRPERLNDIDWSKISDATEYLNGLPIHINDQSGLTINQIRGKARALRRKLGGKLRVLVVDHLALTRGADPKMLRTYQLAEVTSGLKALAKELNCVVYLLVQINRVTDGRPDSMPQLADIRDTSSVEDDSDIVVFGHREYKNNPGLADEWKYFGELSVAKHRDGELGRIPVMFVGENVRWTNWSKDVPTPKSKTIVKKEL